MYINPSFHDCLDEDGNFSEAKRDEQFRYMRDLLERPIEYRPVGRAVIVMESGQVTEVVTDQMRGIDIAILDCGHHGDGEPETPGGETVRLAVCNGAAQRVEESFVEETFAAGATNPVHIRLVRFGVETSPAYGNLLNTLCLEEIDGSRLDEPAAVVQLVRWLLHDAPGDNMVAFHFRGDALVGCTVEQAGLSDSTLTQAPVLFRAVIQCRGDSVALAFRPDQGGVPDIPPGLVSHVDELARIGETIGVRVRDSILTGSRASSRMEFVSLLHPREKPATPSDGEKP